MSIHLENAHARLFALALAVGTTPLFFAPLPANATNWYIDGVAGRQNNPGTAAAPFATIYNVLKKLHAGDTVYFVPSMTYPMLGLTANGTITAPITFAGASTQQPTKVSGGGTNTGIWINGNYLIVKNFDVVAPGDFTGIGMSPNHHHITIANNVVHNAGDSGINTIATDYLTVSHNTVYATATNTSRAFGSGISILGSVDVDENTGTKIVIDGNIIYKNTNIPYCSTAACLASAEDSDGSGIILDDNQRQRFDNIPYKGAFLISNNVIYQNGGRGVHVYRSDNATITGNTMWHNNQDPYESLWHPGEVSVVQGGHVSVYNNLLYSDGLAWKNASGTAPNSHYVISFEGCTDGRGRLIAQYNLGYNPQKNAALFYFSQGNTNPTSVYNNLFSGPRLTNPSIGDFRFNADSPAYLTGNASHSVAVDMLGAARLPLPSIGAYQNPAS